MPQQGDTSGTDAVKLEAEVEPQAQPETPAATEASPLQPGPEADLDFHDRTSPASEQDVELSLENKTVEPTPDAPEAFSPAGGQGGVTDESQEQSQAPSDQVLDAPQRQVSLSDVHPEKERPLSTGACRC